MGQKINPQLFRLGITTNWQSRWFDSKNYAKYLLEDYHIRKTILNKFKKAVADIEIERFGKEVNITIITSRPGVIIGRGGSGVEELKKAIKKVSSLPNVTVNIREVKNPEVVAGVIANGIVEQIEKRIPFRRAMKQALEAAKQAHAEGIRIVVAGRLNGAEIARTESLSYGKVPLHTIRQFIDYASKTAFTTYGTIGVKVWVSRPKEEMEEKVNAN
jgi:small subunit ribosomal protein S3